MKRFSRGWALFSIYFIAAVDNCGYSIVFVLFPSLLLDPRYGFTHSHEGLMAKLMVIGMLYAAFPIAQLISAPIIGEFADRYGRKRLFFFTILGTIVGYLFTGAMLAAKSILLVFFGRFITGLFSGNLGLCNAAIADLSPNEKQRAKNYGLLTVVWGISFPIALLLGGILSDPQISKHFSPALPFYLAGLITILSLMTVIFFYPETFKGSEKKLSIELAKGFQNIREAFMMPHTRKFFLLMLIWTIGWGYSVVWYGAYCIQKFSVSQEVVTLGLVIQGIFWTFGGAVVKPILLKRFSVNGIAKISYALAALFLIVSAFMPTFVMFTSSYALAAVVGALSLSSTFNLISTATHANAQGKSMGIASSMMSLGSFLVPILGGVTGALSIYTFYPIAAFFMALGLVILFRTR